LNANLPNILALLSLTIGLLACGSENKATYRRAALLGSGADAASNVKRTPVNFKLPSRGDDPAMTAALTGYYYRLQGEGPECPPGEVKEEVGAYEDDKLFIMKLAGVCDYSVTMKFGVLGPQAAATPLALNAKLNYEDTVKGLLATNCVSCHETYGDYNEVVANGDIIMARIESGSMPPTAPLNDLDIAQMLAWKDGGYVEKDETPKPTELENGLSAVYYRNNDNDFLRGVELKTRSQYELRRSLWLQEEGHQKGLKVNEFLSFGQDTLSAP